jgi:hypothetical protein
MSLSQQVLLHRSVDKEITRTTRSLTFSCRGIVGSPPRAGTTDAGRICKWGSDKEKQVAAHQTGVTAVIHAGIYYQPGSLKAHVRLSMNLRPTLRKAQPAVRACGKVVVA